jgi:transposase-like protein
MKIHSNELKDQVLKEIKEVGNVSLVCKKHGLKTSTVHGWLDKIKNKDKIIEAKANRQLQKKVKDLELQVEVLTSLLKKTYPLWNNEKPLS